MFIIEKVYSSHCILKLHFYFLINEEIVENKHHAINPNNTFFVLKYCMQKLHNNFEFAIKSEC